MPNHASFVAIKISWGFSSSLFLKISEKALSKQIRGVTLIILSFKGKVRFLEKPGLTIPSPTVILT